MSSCQIEHCLKCADSHYCHTCAAGFSPGGPQGKMCIPDTPGPPGPPGPPAPPGPSCQIEHCLKCADSHYCDTCAAGFSPGGPQGKMCIPDTPGPPGPPAPGPPGPNTCTNNPECTSFPWNTKSLAGHPAPQPLDAAQSARASQFMRNLVNEYGCFKDGNVVAAVDGGMHGKECLKSLCPYGMSYNPDSTNTAMDAAKIIGNDCVDVKAPKCSDRSIMGQCLDDNSIYKGSFLKQVYNTWFWLPNLSKEATQAYIDTQILTCHAMAHGGINGKTTTPIPVSGLCLPALIWPDGQNLTFLANQFGKSLETNRKIFANWLVTNWLENSNLTSPTGHRVNPGFLLYISFKDGPWQAIYADAVTNKTINPITQKPFGPYQDWKSSSTTPGGGSQWVWGAFIHFMKYYVAPACKKGKGKLPAKFWLHLDKEGSQSSDGGLTDQMYTNAVAEFIGPLIQNWRRGEPILYLATGVDGGAAMAPKENYYTGSPVPTCQSTGLGTFSWCGNTEPYVGVPEWYWGLGNQMPCDGSEGSYGYARAACTSLSSHRRLAGYPKQFMNLISGTAGTTGSDCKDNGWLGLGGLKDAVSNAAQLNVWPSFSIENLSMCDRKDTNCYNRWQHEKMKSKDGSGPLSYTGDWGENTTICNSMIWGSLREKGTESDLKQGMRQCGVFDGFSYWTWNEYANYLNYFANTYKSPNLITYEASFIPYHWLYDLGVTADTLWQTVMKDGKQQAAMLAAPASSHIDPSTCPYYQPSADTTKCPKVDKNHPPGAGDKMFCDSNCSIPCSISGGKNNCKSSSGCGTGGSGPGPGDRPSSGGSCCSVFGKHSVLIILLIVLGVLLLGLGAYFLFRRKKKM